MTDKPHFGMPSCQRTFFIKKGLVNVDIAMLSTSPPYLYSVRSLGALVCTPFQVDRGDLSMNARHGFTLDGAANVLR